MRTLRAIYYRLVNRFANIEIPLNAGEFQLIDRVLVQALRQCDDYYPYLRGLIANCGFRAVGVSYTWKARKKGFSKNRFYQLFDQALNGFSNVRASVGARLNTITTQQSVAGSQQVQLQSSISSLQSLDYASAITTLNQQNTTLSAALQAYSLTQSLSLFKYI